jgi:hypothetical protein
MNDLLTARDRLRPSLVDFLLARIAGDEMAAPGSRQVHRFKSNIWTAPTPSPQIAVLEVVRL